jgi:hypothetical protein
MAALWPLVFHPIWYTSRGSEFGPLSKVLIVLSDSQHRPFGLRIFCTSAPVVKLINEVTKHSAASVRCKQNKYWLCNVTE